MYRKANKPCYLPQRIYWPPIHQGDHILTAAQRVAAENFVINNKGAYNKVGIGAVLRVRQSVSYTHLDVYKRQVSTDDISDTRKFNI